MTDSLDKRAEELRAKADSAAAAKATREAEARARWDALVGENAVLTRRAEELEARLASQPAAGSAVQDELERLRAYKAETEPKLPELERKAAQVEGLKGEISRLAGIAQGHEDDKAALTRELGELGDEFEEYKRAHPDTPAASKPEELARTQKELESARKARDAAAADAAEARGELRKLTDTYIATRLENEQLKTASSGTTDVKVYEARISAAEAAKKAAEERVAELTGELEQVNVGGEWAQAAVDTAREEETKAKEEARLVATGKEEAERRAAELEAKLAEVSNERDVLKATQSTASTPPAVQPLTATERQAYEERIAELSEELVESLAVDAIELEAQLQQECEDHAEDLDEAEARKREEIGVYEQAMKSYIAERDRAVKRAEKAEEALAAARAPGAALNPAEIARLEEQVASLREAARLATEAAGKAQTEEAEAKEAAGQATESARKLEERVQDVSADNERVMAFAAALVHKLTPEQLDDKVVQKLLQEHLADVPGMERYYEEALKSGRYTVDDLKTALGQAREEWELYREKLTARDPEARQHIVNALAHLLRPLALADRIVKRTVYSFDTCAMRTELGFGGVPVDIVWAEIYEALCPDDPDAQVLKIRAYERNGMQKELEETIKTLPAEKRAKYEAIMKQQSTQRPQSAKQ
ncbi:hypothetical protein HY489_01095 [Candidatus Woesearchaeota archaeon]|nr:hypothetical protein [Candidatus Woesearchaeota archaeon]